MITSMTGFAHSTISVPGPNGAPVTITLSLKALNTRYFEATCKLPDVLSYLETNLVKTLKQTLRRGHVILSIRPSSADVAPGTMRVSIPIIKSYVDGLRHAQQELDLSGQITIEQAARCQAAFSVESRPADESVQEAVMQGVRDLIALLQKERVREGVSLKKDIEQRCAIMQKEIDHIANKSQEQISKQKDMIAQVTQQIEQLGENEDSQAFEVKRATLLHALEKMAINEEVVRFKTHLQHLQEFIDSDKPEKGKRIDFIVQELGREVNTIAAKCSSAAIGHHAINIKVELEKIREQAQNIV